VGNRSSTSYDNLTLLNIYDAEATAGRLACCWQHVAGNIGTPPQKKVN